MKSKNILLFGFGGLVASGMMIIKNDGWKSWIRVPGWK